MLYYNCSDNERCGYMARDITINAIKRLPIYYVIFEDLYARGVHRVSSSELSSYTKFTASQIRADLNTFGAEGRQGYGYNVETIYMDLKGVLGLDYKKNLILTGVGNIGQAIIQSREFESSGFKFIGLFDSNPNMIGLSFNGIKVRNISELEDFAKNNSIDIGVIAVTSNSARDVARTYEKIGIKAIWNFAPTVLDLDKDIIVENVPLSESLFTLNYLLKCKNDGTFTSDDYVNKAKDIVYDKELGRYRQSKKRGRPRKESK